MPKIKIKRGSASELSDKKLLSGELALATDTQRLYAGNSDSDDGTSLENADNVSVKYAERIGSSKNSHPSIGGDTDESGSGSGYHYGLKPVYVNSDGQVVAASLTHGSIANPVYVQSGGISRCTATVGGDDHAESPDETGKGMTPIFMGNGEFREATESHGTEDQPVYILNGKIVPGYKYGGGTKVTLNDSDKGHNVATIYAPENKPSTSGAKLLVGLYSRSDPYWSAGNFGSDSTHPVYFSDNGAVSVADKYAGGSRVKLNGNTYAPDPKIYAPIVGASREKQLLWADSDGNPVWANSVVGGSLKPIYISSTGIPTACGTGSNLGNSNKPVYMYSDGTLTECNLYAGGTRLNVNGNNYTASATIYAPSIKPSTAKNVLCMSDSDSNPSWKDAPYAAVVWSNDYSTETEVTVNDMVDGIYAVFALRNSDQEYYTFYLVIHSTANAEFNSTSYMSDTPARVSVHAESNGNGDVKFSFLKEIVSSFYFRRIYKVANL